MSVTLDKQSIKMYKGGTAALNAEVSPFGVKPDGVTWKSSDETVATVNERGIITGVTSGVGSGRFDPDAACTRAQIAAFLYRSMK